MTTTRRREVSTNKETFVIQETLDPRGEVISRKVVYSKDRLKRMLFFSTRRGLEKDLIR